MQLTILPTLPYAIKIFKRKSERYALCLMQSYWIQHIEHAASRRLSTKRKLLPFHEVDSNKELNGKLKMVITPTYPTINDICKVLNKNKI